MEENELRAIVVDTLMRIAPEVAADELDAAKPLRKQVDLDSMDWLNFLIALDERLAVEIPEADYTKLVTLNDVVRYLSARGR